MMKCRQLGFLLYLIFLFATISGCASHMQYRTTYDVCNSITHEFSPSCDTHAIHHFSAPNGVDFLLSIVEFDDQGRFWDRKQMNSVITLLSTEAAKKDLLIVVFAHGWKNNAAPNNERLNTFRKVLAQLSEDEAFLSDRVRRPRRQVAGVYLGWRGSSVNVPGLEDVTTFWDRKNTAEKVGHGGVSEVLSRLEKLKEDKDSTLNGSSTTRLVAIGHSFGGLIIHTALTQILENRFINTTGPAGLQSDVAGYGNLVVLINPAFEAQQFASLSDMSTERGTYFKSQVPVVAILTSEADDATRFAFPAGRKISTIFEKTHETKRWNATTQKEEIISESEANVTAVGHFQPFRTHKLYPNAESSRSRLNLKNSDESVQSALIAASVWESDNPGSKIHFQDVTLERTETSAGRNPYLVISVDKELIKNHSDIDDDRIINFLRQMALISTTSDKDKEILYQSFGIK